MSVRARVLLSFLAATIAVTTAAVSSGASAQIAGTRNPAALPPLPKMGPSFRQKVNFGSQEPRGTIIVRPGEKALFLVVGEGQAIRYRISVGRDGFGWTGSAKVGAKKEWPEWRPPAEMRAREPGLPDIVPPGPYNPMGARALYLYRNGQDTLYRIHGTNDPGGVGFDGTSGCFRLTNTDAVDLYQRVAVGSKVVVE
jgi:lipoprotein-anchoring transpeptidase ErfK/SrfK